MDEIDTKILKMLILDARTSLSDIAKICDISSVSVLNRIKRLKKLGVITGATLFPALEELGFQITALIGVQTNSNTEELKEFLKTNTCLIEPSSSIGEYDFCALVYAENIASLNEKIDLVRRRFGVRKVIVNVYSKIPTLSFENIDLNPLKRVEE
ncbi:MAG: Lrp/AsnC family transcriptional regulator [Candidatus Bathyarchaeia archaeon]|jgi:DNA-binding Lrp family transcriptional regulator